MSDVKKHLTHLEAVGLIRLVETHPELEFMFRHGLIREAAYKSLLREDRKKLHRQVGEAIEQTYPDQVASRELAPVLADHFAKAGDDQRALKYFTLAGDANAAIYANAEAAENYTHALEIARHIETSSEKLTYLYTHLGRTLELNSQFDQVLAIYEEMNLLAQQRSDRSMELASMMARLPLYAIPTPLHDPTQAQILAEQALTLARDLNDQVAEAKILWNLNNIHMYSNQITQAIEYGEQSIALARKSNLKEQMALALNDVASNLWSIGQFDRAKEFFSEAVPLWRELDNLPMLANSLSASCSAYVFAGDYDQAIAVSQEAFQVCQDIDNLMGQAFSRMRVGLVYWERGQPRRAITEMEEGIRLGELSGAMVPQITPRVDLSLVYGNLGETGRGLDIAQHALELAETHIPFFRTYALGALTQLHLMKDNLTEAEATVEQSNKDPDQEAWPIFFQFFRLAVIELTLRQRDYEQALAVSESSLTDLHEFGMRMPMPNTLYLNGQALLGLGKNDAARDRLIEARAEAEAIGSRRMLWQILAALAEIETDPTEAETLRQQAQEIIEYIADHTPADLRASFLNLPGVRAVLGG